MTFHDRRQLLLTLIGVGVICVLPITVGAPVDLLLAAPCVVLVLPLLAGRYLGESVLERLVRGVARQRQPRPAARSWQRHGRPEAAVPRGGALIAWSLAVRPPPAAALTIT